MPKIICLIGMDGSGKSTLATNLSKKLSLFGFNSRLIHMYHEPLILKPLKFFASAFFLKGERAGKDYVKYKQQKNKSSLEHPWLAMIYRWIWIADYNFQVLFYLTLRMVLAKEDYFILDRYIYDTLMNISVSLDWSESNALDYNHKWFQHHLTPEKLFVIDLPENIAYSRKNDIPSIEYLHERRIRYLTICKSFDGILLNGLQDQNILVDSVINILNLRKE